jgi:hypothetical protein
MIRAAGAMVVALTLTNAAPQQPRDPRLTKEPRGTGVITGTVVSNDPQPRPLRRSRITLKGTDLPIARTTIAAEDGSFAFDHLPAGSYTLSATKDAYVTMNFGARRPRRPGVRVNLAEGQRRTLGFRLPRGAVITGVISGADGQPIPGLAVVAAASIFNPNTGVRQLSPMSDPFTAAVTDDRGTYRLYGLAAGVYAVVASVRPGPDTFRLVSAQGLRIAAADGTSKPVTLAPVYFPGTPSMEMATLITVKEGEERTGIDFPIEYVPAARIEGAVGPPDPAIPVWVNLRPDSDSFSFRGQPAARADADGRFSLNNVPPGNYTVFASRRMTSAAGSQTLSAAIRLTIAGDDVSGVLLQLQPGLTISGRLNFEGTAPPIDFSKLKLFIPAGVLSGSAVVGSLPELKLETDGRFSLQGVSPGVYRVMAPAIQGLRTPIGKWWLKSVTLRGRELLDAPLEFRESASDGVITFSEHANEVSGSVAGAQSADSFDGFVVVFTTDRRGWFPMSRRVAGVRPDKDGRYSVRNLPAGEYFILATDDLAPNEWFDSQLLEQLASRAQRVKVGTDKTTVDLTWVR